MSSADPTPPPRIGHREREEAVQALAEHYSSGRITGEEYEERVTLAWQAKIAPDLTALFTDLPEPRPNIPGDGTGTGPTALRPGPGALAGYGGHPSAAAVPGGHDVSAPFGREPFSGLPYSDKSKVVAGVLQVLLPFGVGRFYTGDIGLAVAQLLVTLFTFGIGAIWPFIDGIVILAGRPEDRQGRPLRS